MSNDTTNAGNNPPHKTTRTVVSGIATLVAITVIGLIFLTEFPVWLGLAIVAVVLIPCQMYLNKTKGRQR